MGYLILFILLTSPLVYWLYRETEKTCKKDYKGGD